MAFARNPGLLYLLLWLRRGASAAVAALGILSLVGFAIAPTRVHVAFAGRAYAAYGGIYIAASLVWLWLVEGQPPTGTDMLGAGIAAIGARHRWLGNSDLIGCRDSA